MLYKHRIFMPKERNVDIERLRLIPIKWKQALNLPYLFYRIKWCALKNDTHNVNMQIN